MNSEVEGLLRKHKKLLERHAVYPFQFRAGDQDYTMAYYYRTSKRVYRGFIITPLPKEESKLFDLFYSFIFFKDNWETGQEDDFKFASKVIEGSYPLYREKLIHCKSKFPELQGAANEIAGIVSIIDKFEHHMFEIQALYQDKQTLKSKVESQGYFTSLEVDKLMELFGASSYHLFWQGVVRLKLPPLVNRLVAFIKDTLPGDDSDVKEFLEMSKVVSDQMIENQLINSTKTFGDVECLKGMTDEEFISLRIEKKKKMITGILDEDFILRKTRNLKS